MKTARILWVEDEQELRDDIAEFLSDEAYEVITACDGSEGCDKFFSAAPDLVLCDIKMPSMSGLEMLEKLKQEHAARIQRTPFVFLTAWGDKSHTVAAKTLGCDDFLVKPIDFDLLLVTIQSKLTRWHEVEYSIEHDQKRFQSVILDTLSRKLKQPVHSLITFAEVMEDANEASLRQYKRHIDRIARDHLRQLSTMIDILGLSTQRYTLQKQQVNPANLLWEAAVTSIGFDRANRLPLCNKLNDKAMPNIDVDMHIMHRAISQIIQETFNQTSLGDSLPYLECRAKNTLVTMTIASSDQRLNEAKNWRTIEGDEMLESLDNLMYFQGLNVLLMREVLKRHAARYDIEITHQYDPIHRLLFSI